MDGNGQQLHFASLMGLFTLYAGDSLLNNLFLKLPALSLTPHSTESITPFYMGPLVPFVCASFFSSATGSGHWVVKNIVFAFGKALSMRGKTLAIITKRLIDLWLAGS